MLLLTGRIVVWYDRRIIPGQDWDAEIHERLDETELFLLLLSSDFLRSGYAMGIEVRRAMELREAGSAQVIPIFLRHCDTEGAPFHHLQALPRDKKPVLTWADKDEALLDVVLGIKSVLAGLEPGDDE